MNLNIKPTEKLNKEKQKLHIKRHNYNNKGITLIALIITIVILLILAVVAINAVQGDGIIGYAKRSKEAYQEGQDKENIKIALGEYEMANYDGKAEKSLAEFLEEKDWCADATENEDGSIDVTTKEGRIYKVNKDGSIEEITGIGLNKKQIILELADEATEKSTPVTAELTATLNGIEGEITWSIKDDEDTGVETASVGTNESNIATISATTGKTITVTAEKVGKATITATCTTTGGDTSVEKLTATCEVIVTTPVEVSKAPFVEYDVTYTDMYNNQEYTKYNGWRLQSATPNGDGTYSNVKLMSTGIPAKLYYYCDENNNEWFVKENKNKEDDGQVNNEGDNRLEEFKKLLKGDSEYAFYSGSDEYYALEASAGLYYNFEKIKFKYRTDSGSNDKNKGYYTKISNNGTEYNETKNGNTDISTNGGEVTGGDLFNIYKDKGATVRLLTLPELNAALGEADVDRTGSKSDTTGLYKLTQLQNGIQNNGSNGSNLTNYNDGNYWLASPYPSTSSGDSVCIVHYYGNVEGSNNNIGGVRPLVCLNSPVRLIDADGDGVLEIEGIK